MAAADQTTDPDGGVGADAEALIRSLGVSAGDRLDGRYRLERVLHTTGPAVTWLAADEKLNRPSRIHLLRSDQPRAEAFMAAARAAAAMADNHFVQVLDAVPDEGRYYVITEWLHDGHTLGEVLAGGPVPIPEAVRITTELARAMTEAHDQGLAHLRLSPKTVLRTDTGEVKILDLCLAAALTGTVSRDPLGTDLTAIGELAYALLTGKRPQGRPVPPSELRPEVTPQLDELVLRILGDESAGPPFQTPTEVADALAQLPRPRYEAPLPSTPQTAPLRHQQTTVMPASTGLPTTALPQVATAAASYQPAPPRPAAHGGHGGHSAQGGHGGHGGSTGHGGSGARGGSRRPAPYDDDRSPRGSRSSGGSSGGRSSSMMIVVGVVAAVVAISLLAYSMFHNDKGKGNPNASGGSPSGAGHASSSAGNTPSAAAGPVTPTAVAIYDGDDSSEGKGSENAVLNGSGKWSTLSYCQEYGTKDLKQKAGTGLVFDLGAPHQISDVTVTVGTAGGSMQMLVGDSSAVFPPAEVVREAPANYTKAAEANVTGTTVDLKPASPVTGRYVLVWFTTLPKEPVPNAKIKCPATFANSISAVKFNGGS